VGDAFGDGDFCHGEGSFKVGGAVVNSVDQVVMDVDHRLLLSTLLKLPGLSVS